MFDCCIIGSGPAGLTAAIYLRRNNLTVAIVEKGAPGGQVVNTFKIENYPGCIDIEGYELASNMYNQAISLGAEFINKEALSITKNEIFHITLKDREIDAKTVVFATGMHHNKLNIETENKYINKGISWCATCDGALYKNKDVAVVGGGSSALKESLYLSRIVEKVYLIHRRDTFRAEDLLIEKVKKTSNIEIIYNDTVVEFMGDNHLNKVRLKSNRILEVSGVFLYVGFTPNTELLRNFDVLNEKGFVKVNEDCETQVLGLYAVGDVINKKVRQIATSVSDGAIAATSISEKL